jgi:hypothetical protein
LFSGFYFFIFTSISRSLSLHLYCLSGFYFFIFTSISRSLFLHLYCFEGLFLLLLPLFQSSYSIYFSILSYFVSLLRLFEGLLLGTYLLLLPLFQRRYFFILLRSYFTLYLFQGVYFRAVLFFQILPLFRKCYFFILLRPYFTVTLVSRSFISLFDHFERVITSSFYPFQRAYFYYFCTRFRVLFVLLLCAN